MGYQNVARAYTFWSQHLTHAPFRVFVYMCLTTLDGDEQPRYYGGQEALSEALGRGREMSHKDVEAVSATIRELRRKGAITTAVTGVRGRRAEYVLNLDGPEVIRLSLTTNQAEPDSSQDEPDCSQAEPVAKENRGTKNTGGNNSAQSLVSLAPAPDLDPRDLDECPGCRFKRWEQVHAAGCRYTGKAWTA